MKQQRKLDNALEREYLTRYPGEAVARLESMSAAEALEVLAGHPVTATLAVWERLSPDVGQEVLSGLRDATAAEVLKRLDPSRAAPLLAGFDEPRRAHYLALLPAREADELREALRYPPDRAGALMDARVRLFRTDLTVREILARLRADRRPGRRGFFVVDSDGRLAGWVEMQDLALAKPEQALAELARPPLTMVDAMAPRDVVVEEMEKHRLTDLAVVDANGRLLGVIRYAARTAAEKEQASLGIQTMVGASRDERALSKASFAVKKRLPWLQINLATAFLAASVVGLFEETIARFTALAVLLPVVAGQSGNTGAQALAVTMRGLALREIRVRHWPRVVIKELNVGLWNGLAVALTTALGVLLWSGSFGLTLVIGISMVMSMIIAGVSGAAIPVLLTVARQDPAQSSSIILTTVTDVAGFFSFLGIATLLAALL